jgi:hypothetical protein
VTRNHSPNGLPTADWCKPEYAEELAARIQSYWAIRGYKVQTGVRSTIDLGEGQVPAPNGTYCIRSNMHAGWPPKDPTAEINWVAAPAGGRTKTRSLHHSLVRA